MASQIAFFVFIFSSFNIPVNLVYARSRNLETAVNNAVLFFKSNGGMQICFYCSEKYFNQPEYYSSECYDQYLPQQGQLEIKKGETTYHAICKGFTEYDGYKQDVECDYPLKIENGVTDLVMWYKTGNTSLPILIDSPVIGTKLKVQCEKGYVANSTVSECMVVDQRPALSPAPVCLRTGCFRMEKPDNGQVSCMDDIVENGTLCNVTCDPGYESNVNSVQCLNGNYSDSFECKKIPEIAESTSSEDDSWIIPVGVVIGIAGIVIIVLIGKWLYRRHNKKKKETEETQPAVRWTSNLPAPSHHQNHQNGIANGMPRYSSPNGSLQLGPLPLQEVRVEIESSNESEEDTESPLDPLLVQPPNIRPTQPNPLPEILPSIQPPLSPISHEADTDVIDGSQGSKVVPLSGSLSNPTNTDSGLPSTNQVLSDSHHDTRPETAEADRKISDPGPSNSSTVSSFASNSRHPNSISLNPPNIPTKYTPENSRFGHIDDESRKEPVENEDVPDAKELDYVHDGKKPVENDDITSLVSTGTGIVDMARNLESRDITQPKVIEEDHRTIPKQVLSELPNPSISSHGAGSDLLTNPTLADFGVVKTESDLPVHEKKPSVAEPETDEAFFSNTTLDSAPTRLGLLEEDVEEDGPKGEEVNGVDSGKETLRDPEI